MLRLNRCNVLACFFAASSCVACLDTMWRIEHPGLPNPFERSFDEREASAEALKCREDYVQISERAERYDVRSWTAHCASKAYRCQLSDGNTTCTAVEAARPPVVPPKPDRTRVTVRREQEPQAALPPNVGEFSFDDSRDAARSVCEQHAKIWALEGTAFSCSAPGALPSQGTYLHFCDGGICRIEERSAPVEASTAAWISAFDGRQSELEGTYGSANVEERKLPRNCQKALQACLEQGEASFHYFWLWETGAKLELSMDRASGSPAIRVVYRKAKNGPGSGPTAAAP